MRVEKCIYSTGIILDLLKVGLIRCSFVRITVVDSVIGPVICVATNSWPINSAGFRFQLWSGV